MWCEYIYIQVAIFDYAHYSEGILKILNPMILFPKHAHKNDVGTIEKFTARFSSSNVLALENGWADVDTILHREVWQATHNFCLPIYIFFNFEGKKLIEENKYSVCGGMFISHILCCICVLFGTG